VAELLVALVPLLLLAALALLALLVPLEAIAGLSLALLAVGLLVGAPTALYYHVLLRRALAQRGSVPKGWYWRPQQHHATLDVATRRRLTPWFVAGGLGFLLMSLGLTLAVSALFLWFRSQGAVLP